ncbi:MAG: DUF2950 family protein [Candidatus Sulfotelmatobacter sp.]
MVKSFSRSGESQLEPQEMRPFNSSSVSQPFQSYVLIAVVYHRPAIQSLDQKRDGTSGRPNTDALSACRQSNLVEFTAESKTRAEYQSSGVMTFVVSRDGVVYEKDLRPSTTAVAPKIKAPTSSGWRPAA